MKPFAQLAKNKMTQSINMMMFWPLASRLRPWAASPSRLFVDGEWERWPSKGLRSVSPAISAVYDPVDAARKKRNVKERMAPSAVVLVRLGNRLFVDLSASLRRNCQRQKQD